MIKKLLIALILSLLPQMVFGALTTVDDFTRANSTVVSDATHPWVEKQLNGEGAINNNQLEITVTATTAAISKGNIVWLGDYCNRNCEFRTKIGLVSGTVTSGTRPTVSIIRDASDFQYVGCLLSLRKVGSTGNIVLHEDNCGVNGVIFTDSGGSTLSAGETEEMYIKLYESGGNLLMDACWGVIGNPCGEWSRVAYNLTAVGVDDLTGRGYMAVGQFDSSGLTRVYNFDDLRMDIPETPAFKPWLSNLTPTDISVHVHSTSTRYNTVVQYGTSPTLSSYTETAAITPLTANQLITRHDITGLTANTKYYYRIKVGSTTDSNIYSFTTLPTNGTVFSYRFAVLGCWSNNATDDPNFNWAFNVLSYSPLFVIAVGDNGYLDGSGDKMGFIDHDRWENLFHPNFQTLRANVPFYAMYNDHDSGKNDNFGAGDYTRQTAGTVAVTNGSKTVIGTGTSWNSIPRTGTGISPDVWIKLSGDIYTYNIDTTQTFNDTTVTLLNPYHGATATGISYEIGKGMWSVNDYYPLFYNNPGIATGYDSNANYFTRQVGRTQFWVANTSQYANNPSDVEGPNKEMLGDNQYNWLFDNTSDNFKTATNLLKFLILPEPLWTDRAVEGSMRWDKYLHERQRLLAGLRNVVNKTIILAGDSHLLMYNSPDFIPNILEVNVSRTASASIVTNEIPQFKTGWYHTPDTNGIVIVDVVDNGTDIIAKINFYDVNNTLLRTVTWSSAGIQRPLICDYDATTCPNGRGAP